MLKANLNELAALQLVLEFIPVEDLLVAAMDGFSDKTDVRSKENADLCFKARETFLK